MAITRTDKVYSGTLTTSSVTAATIAASTTFIMKGFLISNANAADKKAELLVDDIRILPYVTAIPTGDSIRVLMDMPVLTTETIKVKGEVASDLDFYVWGVQEVTS